MAEQPTLGFGGLLRQLRAEVKLTQEELAEAAGLSPRSISDLERGINRTARKETAELLADALNLAMPARELFVAAARGRASAEDVLAAREGRTLGAGQKVALARECPYRGLLPFSESDSEFFYGRERLAAELAVKLASRVTSGGLVVVTGASGSGKSSLLRAGLLPILAKGQQVPGSNQWPRIVMTPTKDPLTELATRLAAVGGPDALAVREGLDRHPDRAHLAIWSAVLAAAARSDEELPGSDDSAARLVLIVDQFEQVFTLNADLGGEATGQAFITALCSAAASPVGPRQEPPALVVIAVRGDFWDRCAAVPELVGALQDGQFVVGPMTESELRLAIAGPAGAAGLRVDPGLTDTILGDLRVAGADRSAGTLPLLSQAMALTWEQREDDLLTSRGYAQAGGVGHAVQTAADRVYDALPAGLQALTPDVLRTMTVASRDGTPARRPVSREDLYTGLPGAAPSDIDAVLDALAAERLAVLNEDRAQISHDVLLRAWPRLRGWLEEDQASWILHGQLADAAAGWRDSRKDPSFLYRGAQLAALQEAAGRWSANPASSPVLTGTQRGFLQNSERAAARSTRRRRAGFALLALLTALAVTAAGFAFSQRAAAIRQRDQAVYNQVIAEALQFGTSDTSLAAQLTLAAYRIQPTPDLASRLLNTENIPLPLRLDARAGDVYSVAFSPDGHTLADGNYDGNIQLWGVGDPAHPHRLGQPMITGAGPVFSVAFSPGGHTLAGGGLSGEVLLWDVGDPAHPRQLGLVQTGSAAQVYSVAFSPDGRTLASFSVDGEVRLWDVADPAHPRPFGQPLTGASGPVAFSPEGHTLASENYDGNIQLWDVADPAHPRPVGQPLTGGTAAVNSVVFSADGHTLAGGGTDGTVWLWDVADPAHPRPLGQALTGSTAAVNSVVFSADGHTLADGSTDGTVGLWDVSDPLHPRPLGRALTGGTAVNSVAFSPDGHTLASGSYDGAIRLWSLPQTILTGSTAGLSSVAFSSDGHMLAGANYDGTVQLWNLTDPAHPRPLGQPLTSSTVASALSVAFSPDGHTLASGNADSTVQLWDVADPAHPRPLGQPQTSGASVSSVAFSRDVHMLASGNDPVSATIRLWDVADPAHPAQLGLVSTEGGPVNAVAFSPDGHTLATGTGDGMVRLWDVADPAHPRLLGQPLTGSSTEIVSVAFSPDGRTLASGKADGTINLWSVADPTHPRPFGRPLTSSAAAVSSVAFSPDGHTLASGNADGTVWQWDVTNPAHSSSLGQPLTSGTAALDSVALSPDGHTLVSASSDGTARLWNLHVQYAIQRICASAGGLTPRQWKEYIPQLQYQPSCIR